MKNLQRTQIVGGTLLEWGTLMSIVEGGPTGFVKVHRRNGESWKCVSYLKCREADDLQCVLREAVLEIEAACEAGAEEPEDLPRPDPSNVDDEAAPAEVSGPKKGDPLPEPDEPDVLVP